MSYFTPVKTVLDAIDTTSTHSKLIGTGGSPRCNVSPHPGLDTSRADPAMMNSSAHYPHCLVFSFFPLAWCQQATSYLSELLSHGCRTDCIGNELLCHQHIVLVRVQDGAVLGEQLRDICTLPVHVQPGSALPV